jgi:hypothetical protein
MTHSNNEVHSTTSVGNEKKRIRLSHDQGEQLIDYVIAGYAIEHTHLPMLDDVLDDLNSLARPEAPFTRGFINNQLKKKGPTSEEAIREVARRSGIYEAMVVKGKLLTDFSEEIHHTVAIPEKMEITDKSTSELVLLMAKIATELVNRDAQS